MSDPNLTPEELTRIVNYTAGAGSAAIVVAVRYILKLRKDLNIAFARIRKLEAPKCEANVCPLKKVPRE